MSHGDIPIPPHFDPAEVDKVWKVNYQRLAEEARKWAKKHDIKPALYDTFKICLVTIDLQNTFCIPEFELYVGGRSGRGAVDDNTRLCEFIYRNIGLITQICPTMDTHQVIQIFHSIYLVNDEGQHPPPFTIITHEDAKKGIWKFNPLISWNFNITEEQGQRHLLYYTEELKKSGKYDLTIWPYHAMLGGIGHALVSSVEEAIFFHSIARLSQPEFHLKGDRPFTENYSVLGPEVLRGPDGELLAERSERFLKGLLSFDAVIIAGQAKSHCVAWTVADLLEEILKKDSNLVKKIYLLEDCTSPVVIPGVIDYTEIANEAFDRFKRAGMNIVKSTDPIESWPDIRL